MNSIKDIRQKTQGHITFPWPDRLVSAYFTWFFIRTPITANQITVLDLLFGLIGCLLLGFGNNLYSLVGGFFLLLFVVFDDVDGEVARFKNTCSKTSFFMEGLCHPILHPLKFLALGFGLYKQFNNDLFILIGIYLGIVIFLELAINWRREIFLKGEYSYARTYKDIQDKMASRFKILFNIAAYVMQEIGMYVVIFMAALSDYLLEIFYPDFFHTILLGTNFKAIILIGYSFAVTLMMLFNLKKTKDLVKNHFNET